MKDFLASELDAFLDTDEFSEVVTLDGSSVIGMVKEDYVEVTIGSVEYHGVKPTFWAKYSELTGMKGKTLVDGDDSYKIIDIQPDGTGMALAILEDA